jgi:hypothetical protein
MMDTFPWKQPGADAFQPRHSCRDLRLSCDDQVIDVIGCTATPETLVFWTELYLILPWRRTHFHRFDRTSDVFRETTTTTTAGMPAWRLFGGGYPSARRP